MLRWQWQRWRRIIIRKGWIIKRQTVTIVPITQNIIEAKYDVLGFDSSLNVGVDNDSDNDNYEEDDDNNTNDLNEYENDEMDPDKITVLLLEI